MAIHKLYAGTCFATLATCVMTIGEMASEISSLGTVTYRYTFQSDGTPIYLDELEPEIIHAPGVPYYLYAKAGNESVFALLFFGAYLFLIASLAFTKPTEDKRQEDGSCPHENTSAKLIIMLASIFMIVAACLSLENGFGEPHTGEKWNQPDTTKEKTLFGLTWSGLATSGLLLFKGSFHRNHRKNLEQDTAAIELREEHQYSKIV
jgi:hypothetical protein